MKVRDAQLSDQMLKPILEGKESDTKPALGELRNNSRAACRLLQLWNQLIVVNGVLCRQFQSFDGSTSTIQIIVPGILQKEVLSDIHEGALGSHLGVDKTLARLKDRFYWPGHYNDVCNWCKHCNICARRKNPIPRARAQLETIEAGYPLQMVAMDILGPLPESSSGNSYILVVSDYFTRWAEAYAIPNQEATTVAQKLTDEFFFRFSPPEQLHSDQGRNFESAVIAEICKLLGIVKSRTTPYHPQSDGLVERFNRTLLSMLATAAQEKPFDWDRQLRRLCLAYNSSEHPTTGGETPFFLMFGRQVRMPIDVMYGSPNMPQPTSVPQYVLTLREDLVAAYKRVREQMHQKLHRQKEIYDKRAHGEPYRVGDLVWLHDPVVPRGQSRKFHCSWSGPFKIVTKISEVVYRLQSMQGHRKRLVVHFDRLKPCPPGIKMSSDDHTASEERGGYAQPPPPVADPVGTSLEILQNDDDEDLPQLPPPDPPVRYPRRARTAPLRYQPMITH